MYVFMYVYVLINYRLNADGTCVKAASREQWDVKPNSITLQSSCNLSVLLSLLVLYISSELLGDKVVGV